MGCSGSRPTSAAERERALVEARAAALQEASSTFLAREAVLAEQHETYERKLLQEATATREAALAEQRETYERKLASLQAEKDSKDEKRVEALTRSFAHRLGQKDLSIGWNSWHAMWAQKVEQRRILAWRGEWVDAWVEKNRLAGGTPFPRSDYEPGGQTSIKARIASNAHAPKIQWLVDNGWPRAQAEAFELVTSCLEWPLRAAVSNGSGRYASSTRLVCEALAERGRKQTEVAPPIYHCLNDKLHGSMWGLATRDPAWKVLLQPLRDPAWRVLLQPGASAGISFVTNGIAGGKPADAEAFPDDKGFYAGQGGPGSDYKLQDCDVVCIRSAPADAFFYRSMVPISESGIHLLPPHAIVTLEKVEGPGEWEVCGHRVQQRLLTVSVAYR